MSAVVQYVVPPGSEILTDGRYKCSCAAAHATWPCRHHWLLLRALRYTRYTAHTHAHLRTHRGAGENGGP